MAKRDPFARPDFTRKHEIEESASKPTNQKQLLDVEKNHRKKVKKKSLQRKQVRLRCFKHL